MAGAAEQEDRAVRGDRHRERASSASGAPNGTAVTCNVRIASAKPTRPHIALAMIAAVAGPPMRGCRISIMLRVTIGNTAKMPASTGPALSPSVTTTPTRSATRPARSGMSNQRRATTGIRTWR